MRIPDSSHVKLVVAAQRGDGRAREKLVATYLPLLYNIVRRALGAHADVDDVVQETLLRVVRDLPALREPNSFRSWLVAIAIRQIVSYRERQRAAGGRVVLVEQADELPEAGFEELAILQLHVSDQRREVAEASRWLDEEHRLLLSLWWQENAGWLSRTDLAAAMGLSVAHAGVRLQRMREQLQLCREIVAALDAAPRCAELGTTVEGWGGGPSPLWRKRIGRHVRGCGLCMPASQGQVPLERLLLTFVPLTVPVGLAAALAAKGLLPGAAAAAATAAAGAAGVGGAVGVGAASAGGAVAGVGGAAGVGAASAGGAVAGAVPTTLIGKLAHSVIAHPVASMATGAAVVVFGSAVTMVTLPEAPSEAPPAVIAAPPTPNVVPNPAVVPSTSPPPPAPRPVTTTTTTPAATSSPTISPGAAPGVPLGTWSLESVVVSGQYVSYAGDYAALQQVSPASSDQVKQQATLTVVKGLADPSCVTFRAADGRYLRHMMMRLRLDNDEGTTLFREDATFCARPGVVPGSVMLESVNYPGQVLRYRGGAIVVNLSDGSKNFGRESSFITRDPWAE